MSLRSDPSLELTAEPTAPSVLGRTPPGLTLASPAGTAAFVVEGQCVVVRGSERTGITEAWIDGRRVLGALRGDTGSCSSVVLSPGWIRRETVGRSGVVHETTLALPSLPLVAVQWRRPDGAQESIDLTLTVHLLPEAGRVVHRTDGGRLVVRDEATDRSVELCLHATSVGWRVSEHEGGGAEASAVIEGTLAATLLITAGPPSERRAALRAAPHLAGHEARVAVDSDPASADLLTLRTGVPEVDEGWAWAVARTRAAAPASALGGSPSPRELGGVFWSGVGALAVGDAHAASRAMDRLGQSPVGSADIRLGSPAPAKALATLLAAGTTLATGDPGPALRRLREMSAAAVADLREASDTHAWAYWRVAVEALSDSLRFAAPEEEIGRLRAASELPPAARGSLRLPMVGTASAPVGPAGPEALRRMLRTAPVAGSAPLPGGVEGPLDSWRSFAAGSPDAGWATWRQALAEGLRAGSDGRGTWDPWPGGPGGARDGAALLLAALVHGMMGIRYDAPTGRLGLAPTLPSHLSRFVADQVPAGEGRVRVEYARVGALHRFVLTPARCRVPPTVVLQPALKAESGSTVRIDGRPAALDTTRTAEGLTRFSVQIPLDGVRTIEIEGAGNDGGPERSVHPGPPVP